MGLVINTVKRYANSSLSFDDLKSAGIEGLINGLLKYDFITYGMKPFSSYMVSSINNTILQELKKENKHNHVLSLEEPISYDEKGNKLLIEDILRIDEDQLLDEVIKRFQSETIKECLKDLTVNERKTILLRYGLNDIQGKTFKEIAEIMNCSVTKVRLSKQKALVKMREPHITKKIEDFY